MTNALRHKPYDAIVIGARCAGAATAMLLARGGARVLCVDHALPGTDTVSTHALMRLGVTQLARWGVLDAIRQAGTPPVRRTLFHYGDEMVAVDIRPSPQGDLLHAPRRTVLDLALVRAAAEAGVEFRFGTSFAGTVCGTSGHVAAAVLRRADGTAETVRTGLLVGADGRRSAVAGAVAAPIEVAGSHTSAVAYAYAEGPSNEGYRWAYAPGAGGGIIPTNGGQSCVFLALAPDRLRPELGDRSPAAFQAALARHVPALAEIMSGARIAGPIIVHAGAKGFVRRAVGPGWALVGDAGYFKDPITAHGITDALRDAEMLASAVLAGRPAAFPAGRAPLIEGFFRLTDEIASFDWSLDRLKAMHVALNTEMKRGQRWADAQGDVLGLAA
jgi:2-polyprenyl-6-methoxyphenol hydroxylase-like FAD-dependent oxidoreductase